MNQISWSVRISRVGFERIEKSSRGIKYYLICSKARKWTYEE